MKFKTNLEKRQYLGASWCDRRMGELNDLRITLWFQTGSGQYLEGPWRMPGGGRNSMSKLFLASRPGCRDQASNAKAPFWTRGLSG